MANPFSGNTGKAFPQSGFGVAGGARGAGAGVLRYLVQFIASYDEGNLQQLIADLEQVNKEQAANAAQVKKLEEEREVLRGRLVKAQEAERVGGKAITDNIKRITGLEAQLLRARTMTVAERKKEDLLIGTIKGKITAIKEQLIASGLISRGQLQTLLQENAIRERRRQIVGEVNALELEGNELARQRNAIDAAGNALMQARATLMPRLAALGLGLVGGLLGGAVFGTALQLGQGAIDALSTGLQKMVDPAKEARDALSDVADIVKELAQDTDLLAAGAAALKDLGPAAQGLGISAERLGQAAALQAVLEKQEKIKQILTTQAQIQALYNERVMEEIRLKIQAGEAAANLEQAYQEMNAARNDDDYELWRDAIRGDTIAIQKLANMGSPWAQSMITAGAAATNAALGLEYMGGAAEDAAEQAQRLKDEADALASIQMDQAKAQIESVSDSIIAGIEAARDSSIAASNAAADAAIDGVRNRLDNTIDAINARAKSRIDALQNRLGDLELQPSGRTRGLEKQLDALKDRGPSQRTRELAAAIERLNKAERERGYNRQLSDLRERKHLLVLEKELRARKEQIDISKYSGKERVVAIDAEMDRLQRRSDEQERFNHLLDLQYQLTRRQVRQEGESIQEFIERRAQENRHILEEAAQIQVDRQKAILEKQKETAQLEVEIEQAKEDIKELIRQHALEKELERLQKLLDASRERDARLLEADRERLQKLLEASKKHDQEVLEAKREALQKQIEAVRENAQQQIEVARDQADKDIQSIERRRDAAIAAANRVADLAIAAEKRRAAEALRILEQTEDERIRLAIAGSKTVADLQGLAGYIAGLNYAEGQLRALFGTYGVDPNAINDQIRRIWSLKAQYSTQFARLVQAEIKSRMHAGGFASGGIVPLRNSTYLGNDMRAGEGGTEWAMIFPNSVVQALQDGARKNGGGGGPVIGSVTLASTESPAAQEWRLQRLIKQTVRDELRRN